MPLGNPTEPQFVPPSFYQPPRRSSHGWVFSLLLIGFGVLTLGGIVCVAGVWYVTANIDRWLVGLGREAIVAMIDDSEIPAQEKNEVIAQIDRVVTAYKERKIDRADLERVLSELEQSPALTLISLYGIDEEYLAGSELPADELEQGRRTFERVLRGVYEGKIEEDDLYAALPGQKSIDMDIKDEADLGKLREAITLASNEQRGPFADDDLRESLARLKVMADNVRIPDEPFQLDIGDEFKKAVDKALAGKNIP
jgi:hypothetical protein